MFRDVLRKVCSEELFLSVIAETDSGSRALNLIRDAKPNLVILDLCLSDTDGFQVLEQGALLSVETKFLIVSANCDQYVVSRLERLRVHGFIDKNSNSIGELKLAVEFLRSGRLYFSATFQAAKLAKLKDQNCFTKVLSDREQHVLSLVGCGCTDDEVGARLNMSSKTAKTHRSNLLRKLNIPSTPKLMAFATSQGLTRFVAGLSSDRSTGFGASAEAADWVG